MQFIVLKAQYQVLKEEIDMNITRFWGGYEVLLSEVVNGFPGSLSWPELIANPYNQLIKPDKQDIWDKLKTEVVFDDSYQPFGDGHSGVKIAEGISRFLEARELSSNFCKQEC